MRIAEIEALDCDFLTVDQVAKCLKCSPQLVRDEARKSPCYLGFPVSAIGCSFRIPRLGFLKWYRGELPVLQIVSSNQLFRDFEKCGLE